jgi:LysM repeat protein
LRVVAEKYKVSKQSLMAANNKKEDITLRGEQLIIPLK